MKTCNLFPTPVLIAAYALSTAGYVGAETPPGYTLAWADEFGGNVVNTQIWERLTRRDDFNNDKQYYIAQQAFVTTVPDPTAQQPRDVLRITATDEPFGDRQYRSGRVESRTETGHTVLYGRVEALARIPTTKGVWPAIWLFPNRDIPWPTGGEIDIMEHRGSRPTELAVTYHYNETPAITSFRTHDITADGVTGQTVTWPDAFHEYAIEWDPHEIRFYVNGYNYFTVVDDSAPAGYKPDEGPFPTRQRHTVPSVSMNVILNTAVGGDFDGDPDGTTVWPQHFDIDYVRVYDLAGPGPRLENPRFDYGDSGWDLSATAALDGDSLRLTSGAIATQQLWLDGGRTTQWTLETRAETPTDYTFDLAYFNAADQLVGRDRFRPTAGAGEAAVYGLAPDDAVYARLALGGPQTGTAWVDGITLEAVSGPVGDFNNDGLVNAADYTVWRDLSLDAFSASAYDAWAAGYGERSTTVPFPSPEPTALALLAVLALSDCRVQRVRRLNA